MTPRRRARAPMRWASWMLVAVAAWGSPIAGCAKGDADVSLEGGFESADDAGSEGGATFTADDPPESTVECADETQQIYVVATDRVLYRFYPETLRFVRVGALGCASTAGTFSMAVDRRGRALVEFADGRLFSVSTITAACKTTPFKPGQTGFSTFGMGYARNGLAPAMVDAGVHGDAGDGDAGDGGADDAGIGDAGIGDAGDAGIGDAGAGDGGDAGAPVGETLYVAGAGLASLDTKSFELTFLGSLTFGRSELTGRGPELFAFSLGSGVIAGLNKTTGATEVIYRSSAVELEGGFAFAQWGGDFWLFTGKTHSKITRYSPATNTSKVVVEDTGMLIVGAGSSTCAPTTSTPR